MSKHLLFFNMCHTLYIKGSGFYCIVLAATLIFFNSSQTILHSIPNIYLSNYYKIYNVDLLCVFPYKEKQWATVLFKKYSFYMLTGQAFANNNRQEIESSPSYCSFWICLQ